MALCLDKSIEASLRSLPGNNICCDCNGKNPQWASVPFGIFMCLECSGRHRALGVHISFVRSVSMDSWTEKQISFMRIGGNAKCNNFLEKYGICKETVIDKKYNTKAAAFYKEMLAAEVNGTSIPIPPESFDELPDEDPIQRELRAREEARERMRQKFGGSKGLSSSGGVLGGIGSDSSYQSSGEANSKPVVPTVDVAQLAEVSQKAFSFISTSLSVIGDQVVKSTSKLLEEQPQSSNNENQQAKGTEGEQWNKTWSILSDSATNIWKQASTATTDMIGIMSAPEENDDLRFPRPLVYSDSNKSLASGNDNVGFLKEKVGNFDSAGSWDSSSDVVNENRSVSPSMQHKVPRPMAGIGNSNNIINGESLRSVSSSGRLRDPVVRKDQGQDVKPPVAINTDDFFATFGL